jgi:hypothetical protein
MMQFLVAVVAKGMTLLGSEHDFYEMWSSHEYPFSLSAVLLSETDIIHCI